MQDYSIFFYVILLVILIGAIVYGIRGKKKEE